MRADKPATTREYIFQIAGDIRVIRNEQKQMKAEIAGLKKANYKAGGVAGAVVGGAVIAILKVFKLY